MNYKLDLFWLQNFFITLFENLVAQLQSICCKCKNASSKYFLRCSSDKINKFHTKFTLKDLPLIYFKIANT